MLALTRKVGESVLIADGLIEVMVVACRRGKVRLAFKAPADVRVDRAEVAARRRREQPSDPGGQLKTG